MKSLETAENTVLLLRQALNLHKSSLADYNFTSSNAHKRLRRALEKQSSAEIIEKEIEALETHLYKAFGNAFNSQMYYLFKILCERSSLKPRACVKVISGPDHITTLYRYPQEFEVGWETIGYNDNTGFIQVLNGAEYFLCNDIPQSVFDGHYKSSRIDNDMVQKYFAETSNYFRPDYDEKWISCWKNLSTEHQNGKSYYKSTLVIPMMIETESLSDVFVKHLKVGERSVNAILGFLCLDHPCVNFFKKEIDVDLCAIFADTLSLFLFQQLNNTLLSRNYNKAIKISKISE
jgi:hypothetical protein